MTDPWARSRRYKPLLHEDVMMHRALDLSDERERLDGDIRVKALLVGGISPPDMRRGERLRARELLLLADIREIIDDRRRRCLS